MGVVPLQLGREVAIHDILQALLKQSESSWSYLRLSVYLLTDIFSLGCSYLWDYCKLLHKDVLVFTGTMGTWVVLIAAPFQAWGELTSPIPSLPLPGA